MVHEVVAATIASRVMHSPTATRRNQFNDQTCTALFVFPKCQDTSFCMGCCLRFWNTTSDCNLATSSFGPMNAEKQTTRTDDRWIVGGFSSPQPGGYLNKGQRSTAKSIGIIFLIDVAIGPHRCILASIKTSNHAFRNFHVSRLSFETLDVVSGPLDSNLKMLAFMCSNSPQQSLQT